MKDFQVFSSYEREKIKAIEKDIKNSYVGFIYILEYGKNIKIGYSKNPVTRIKSLKKQAEYGNIKLGNVAISKPHTNYIKNEKLLHQYFKQYRIAGTELFTVTLKQVLSDFPNDLKFLDESERLIKEGEQGLKFLKKFLGFNEINTSPNNTSIQTMENQITISDKKMNEFKINPIEKNGQRVLITAQLAEAYGTNGRIISNNFNRNRERFIEGKHFYRLTDKEKHNFFNNYEFRNGSKANVLYLWTERGALLLAKILNTDKAWEAYEYLIEYYFRTREMNNFDNEQLYQQLKVLEQKIDALEKNSSDRTDSIIKNIEKSVYKTAHTLIPCFELIYNHLKEKYLK